MTRIGKVKVVHLEEGRRKSAYGKGEDMGAYIKVHLNPSKRRTRFNTILIPWTNVVKVVVLE